MSRRVSDTSFWKWYRSVPLTCIALILLLSLAFQNLPSALMKAWFYPLHYTEAIDSAATTYKLDPYLVCAMIKCESNWEVDATSTVGAEGLMQMMPDTAKDLARRGLIDSNLWRVDNLYDPSTNIMYGCCYLAHLLHQSGSQDEAIAAYNAGPSVASNWADKAEAILGGNFVDAIQYPETKSYVKRVQIAELKYKELYSEGLKE